jgi:hypothetical protein
MTCLYFGTKLNAIEQKDIYMYSAVDRCLTKLKVVIACFRKFSLFLLTHYNRLRGRGVRVDDFLSSYLSGVGSIPGRCFGSLARRKVV